MRKGLEILSRLLRFITSWRSLFPRRGAAMTAIGFARGLPRHPEGLPALPFAWLEGFAEAGLDVIDRFQDWHDLERWPEGRLFGPAGEYRWRRLGDGSLHAVLILEGQKLPEPFAPGTELELLEERELHLWGEWVDPSADPHASPDAGSWFYAPEIPRPQRYPLELGASPHAGKEARLVVRSYRPSTDSLTGEVNRLAEVKVVTPPRAKSSERGQRPHPEGGS